MKKTVNFASTEPISDDQLNTIMRAVAISAKTKAQAAKKKLQQQMKKDIEDAKARFYSKK